jgi:hypothetical protein
LMVMSQFEFLLPTDCVEKLACFDDSAPIQFSQ